MPSAEQQGPPEPEPTDWTMVLSRITHDDADSMVEQEDRFVFEAALRARKPPLT